MNTTQNVVIAGAARTPMGGFQGSLSTLTAADLGGAAIAGALADTGADLPIDEVIMGCVLPAGQGQAPARQAGFAAGLDQSVPALTINKMCGSGMRAVMQAADQIALGCAQTIVAGGMESMSNAPYLLPKIRDGARIGHGQVVDSMFLDGLEDAYSRGTLMGVFAEECAEAYQFSRTDQDNYALASLARAQAAQEQGHFNREIVPVTAHRGRDTVQVTEDEQPKLARPEKVPHLKPAFKPDGTVTAANASSISDGAAALVISSEGNADAYGLQPRAIIMGHATHAQAPKDYTTAPAHAARKLLDHVGWATSDVDLWEVNEAFAVVAMAFMHDMGLSHDVVNVNGGACALGHPIGASGARILVTLLNAMERQDVKRGVAAICIGGGEATAVAIERP
ncbi:MAG: thiolase family protein [Pseudomonadota bacterium]